MKYVSLLIAFLVFTSCSSAQKIKLGDVAKVLTGKGELSNLDVANGLKEALQIGASKGADALSQLDGYYKSPYKILMPEEARQIVSKVKNLPGFGDVEQKLEEKMNRAAEDAAVKAKPIFVNAITSMSIEEAWNILKGEKNAATVYLQKKTSSDLYKAFNPVIVESLDKVNAREYWTTVVNAYNKIPLVNKMNPSLDDYVTQKALDGMFSMVEKEERNIRANVSARTSDLLKKVFERQDQ